MRLTRRFLADGTMWRGAPLCVGVIGNHLVDEVMFEIPADLTGYSLFLKVGTVPPGKIALLATEDGFLWTMRRGELTGAETMCQLQAEKSAADDVIVWQSRPFTVHLAETIEADQEIEAGSLPYLQALDARIAANADRAEAAATRAEQAGGGGGGYVGGLAIDDVSGLTNALSQKADIGNLADHVENLQNPHAVTQEQLGGAAKEHSHVASDIINLAEALSAKADTETLTDHLSNTANPHGVTREQIGAAPMAHGHPQNDVDGLAEALNKRAMAASLDAHVARTDNPHGITAIQIGAAKAAHAHDIADIAGLQEMIRGGLPLKAGGAYSTAATYAPLTLVRGEHATYLSIQECTGIALTDAAYWQLIVRDGESGGTSPVDPEPEIVYLAKYCLTGEAESAAPTTIEDVSGNGNDMTVTGISAYNAFGNLAIADEGSNLYLPTINLAEATDYTIHIKMGAGAWSSQHRIFHIPSNDMHLMLVNYNGNSTCLKYESAYEEPGFSSPVNLSNFAPTITRYAIRGFELNIAVAGDSVTFSAKANDVNGNVFTSTDTQTIVGFTSHLAQGVYLGNRSDGTRPLGVAISEFWIQA